MITQETLKRIYLYGLIAAVGVGLIFVLFAVFINKGTLTVIAKAPFTVNIGNIKTEICVRDECSIVMAPGEYTVIVKKAGHKDYVKEISVPVGGETREEAAMIFIPVVREVDPEEDVDVFGIPIVDMDQLADKEPYFDENYVVYLEREIGRGRQALFVVPLRPDTSGKENAPDYDLGEPYVAASFIRTISDYVIYPFITAKNKIVLVDKTLSGAALYLVDLTAKTRDNLVSFPVIENVKWLPETDDFIFEARDKSDLINSIYLYQSNQAAAVKLGLPGPLAWIEPLDSRTLIAATNQNVVGPAGTDELIGSLVSLSAIKSEVTNFITYDLITGDTRFLAYTDVFYDLEEAKLRPDKKGVYLLQGAKIFELMLEE